MADHGKRLVVKCAVSYLRVNESISGVPGDNRTERMSLRPTVPRRMPVFNVGGGSHWPTGQTPTIAGRLSMTNVAALMPQTITATSVTLVLHGYRCGESRSHV